MSQTKLVKFSFQEGQKQTWVDWCAELQRRSDEVLESLRAEKVIIEACFISEQENACYYLMQAEDFEKSTFTSETSHRSIDDEHKAVRKLALQKVEVMQPSFYFQPF
jgi:hypothetical protein